MSTYPSLKAPFHSIPPQGFLNLTIGSKSLCSEGMKGVVGGDVVVKKVVVWKYVLREVVVRVVGTDNLVLRNMAKTKQTTNLWC